MAKKKLSKTWPYCKTTPAGVPVRHTSGYLSFNDEMFNKMNHTDDDTLGSGPATPDTAVDSGNTSASVGGDSGGLAESMVLQEAKREVRRYYLKPQNIWCSNKAEVLKALVDVGTNDCVIYTLKNLVDNDDIHKLSDKDIIYYFEDGILYDKNKVRVMDYDLVIKHEEDRPKLTNNASDATFRAAYEDRITDQSVVEDLEMTEAEKNTLEEFLKEDRYTKEELCAYLAEHGEITLGHNEQDADVMLVDGEQYSHTDYSLVQYGNSYGIYTWLVNKSGGMIEGNVNLDFDSFDDAWDYIIDHKLNELTDSILILDDAGAVEVAGTSETHEPTTELKEEVIEKLTKADLLTYLDTYSELSIGYNQDDADIMYVGNEQYSDTEYRISSLGNHTYTIDTWYVGKWGEEREGNLHEVFHSFEDLWSFILQNNLLNLEESPLIVESAVVHDDSDAFFLEYDAINAYGEALTEGKKKQTCCICGEELEGYGNNPAPYRDSGVCCDACNAKFVIPARLDEYQESYDLDNEQKDEQFDEALKTGDFSAIIKEDMENPDESAADDLFAAADSAKGVSAPDVEPCGAADQCELTADELAEIPLEPLDCGLTEEEIDALVKDQIV